MDALHEIEDCTRYAEAAAREANWPLVMFYLGLIGGLVSLQRRPAERQAFRLGGWNPESGLFDA